MTSARPAILLCLLFLGGCPWDWDRFEPPADGDADGDADQASDGDFDDVDDGGEADEPDGDLDADPDADGGATGTWSKQILSARLFGATVADDGTIYAVGDSGDKALAVSLDRRGNQLERATFLPGGWTKASASAVVIHGDELYLVGPGYYAATDPQDGMLVVLDRHSLAVVGEAPRIDVGREEKIEDVAVSADGTAWMVGRAVTPSLSDVLVAVERPSGERCSWLVRESAETVGWGRTIVLSGDDVYVAGDLASDAWLARLPGSACLTFPTCSCEPEWESTIAPWGGGSYAGARAMERVGTRLFAALFELDGADGDGLLASVDTTTGEQERGDDAYDPTGLFDWYVDIAIGAGAERAYVAGTRGYAEEGEDWLAGASAVVAAYGTDDLTPIRERTLATHRVMTAIEVDPDGGVVAVGVDALEGWPSSTVVRCLSEPELECPES